MKKKTTNIPLKEQNNLSEEVYKKIRQTIFLSDYFPGQKLEYRKIAEGLGMSPTPVLQALKHMELLGLVRHEPNRGFSILEITYEQVKEASKLREILMLALIPDIIANLDGGGEKKLKMVASECRESSKNNHIKLRLAMDMKFHLTIAELSNQPLTVRILRDLFDYLYLNRYRPGFFYYRPNNAADHEHDDIFDALMARDIEAAKLAVRTHIRNVCDDTLEAMAVETAAVGQIYF